MFFNQKKSCFLSAWQTCKLFLCLLNVFFLFLAQKEEIKMVVRKCVWRAFLVWNAIYPSASLRVLDKGRIECAIVSVRSFARLFCRRHRAVRILKKWRLLCRNGTYTKRGMNVLRPLVCQFSPNGFRSTFSISMHFVPLLHSITSAYSCTDFRKQESCFNTRSVECDHVPLIHAKLSCVSAPKALHMYQMPKSNLIS